MVSHMTVALIAFVALSAVLIGALLITMHMRHKYAPNLIGVGIVPLLFADGTGVDALNLVGSEEYSFEGVGEGIAARRPIGAQARRPGGEQLRFEVVADVRSAAEAELLARGGMFQAALEAALA